MHLLGRLSAPSCAPSQRPPGSALPPLPLSSLSLDHQPAHSPRPDSHPTRSSRAHLAVSGISCLHIVQRHPSSIAPFPKTTGRPTPTPASDEPPEPPSPPCFPSPLDHFPVGTFSTMSFFSKIKSTLSPSPTKKKSPSSSSTPGPPPLQRPALPSPLKRRNSLSSSIALFRASTRPGIFNEPQQTSKGGESEVDRSSLPQVDLPRDVGRRKDELGLIEEEKDKEDQVLRDLRFGSEESQELVGLLTRKLKEVGTFPSFCRPLPFLRLKNDSASSRRTMRS